MSALEVYGVRSWDVDSFGRLVGVRGHIWTRGTQLAECAHCDAVDGSTTEKCSCGFYALTDGGTGANLVSQPGVTGIARGHGEVAVGENGWRASRAEVVALVLPPLPVSWWRSFVLSRGAETAADAVGSIGLFAGIVIVVASLIFDSEAWKIAFPAVLLCCALLWLAHVSERHRLRLAPAAREKLVRNYPDVRIFPSLPEALKAFPIPTLAGPTDDPEDPAFWTQPTPIARRSHR